MRSTQRCSNSWQASQLSGARQAWRPNIALLKQCCHKRAKVERPTSRRPAKDGLPTKMTQTSSVPQDEAEDALPKPKPKKLAKRALAKREDEDNSRECDSESGLVLWWGLPPTDGSSCGSSGSVEAPGLRGEAAVQWKQRVLVVEATHRGSSIFHRPIQSVLRHNVETGVRLLRHGRLAQE